MLNVYSAREKARRGDHDDAIPLMRVAVDHLFREGQLLGWGIPATDVLVETLLDRGNNVDMAEAEAAIKRLARLPADGFVLRDIWLLRLRPSWRGLTVMPRLTRTSATAIARWRHPLGSKAIPPGPRPCHDAWHPGRAAHVVLKQTTFASLESQSRFGYGFPC